ALGALVAGAGRVRPVVGREAVGVRSTVVDLEVQAVEGAEPAVAQQVDRRLDAPAGRRASRRALDAVALEPFVARTERDLVVRVDADLRVVVAEAGGLEVPTVDVDLDRVLLPRVGVRGVDHGEIGRASCRERVWHGGVGGDGQGR